MNKTTQFNRREFLKTFTAATAGLTCFPSYPSAALKKRSDDQRPNILLVVSDDQGYGDSSCYFHPKEIDTPNIDRLSKRGIRMTNGYASACVCAPTRAGLLTGRYQERFGFYTAAHSRIGMPLDEITLADILKKQGYATGIFGKWHLGINPEYHPLERGFDEFYGFLGHGAHDYYDLTPSGVQTSIYRNNKIISDTGYLTDNLAREAVSFINEHKDEPYFCYLPFNAVHWPLQAPDEIIQQYDTGDNERNIYLAMLEKMDDAIGQVLDAVENTGMMDNTLIIFFSDNGGAKKNHSNNGRLRDYKHSVYEGGIRVPFIVSWPGELGKGIESNEPVICLDVMQTVCAAVGAELPRDRIFDGKNMLPVLKGETDKSLHEYLYWNDGKGQWAIRGGDWKLLQNRKGRIELYNLKDDLGETNDLSKTRPDIYKRLEGEYNRWIAEMGEPLKKTNKVRQIEREQRKKKKRSK